MKKLNIKITKILALFYLNLVRLFGWTELYQPTYNPKNYFLFKKNVQKRNSDDRIEFIKQNINFTETNTYLDIGSQLGYFVFELSDKQNIIAQGIEMNPVSWAYSNAINSIYQIDNISFAKCKLNSQISKKLSNYDVISFLNVFHHIVHFEGFKEADKIMKILSQKCKYFIFETGQYTEKDLYWSNDLAFMGEKPKEWLEQYLITLNYKIIAAKNFSNHLNNHDRTLFICKKIK